MDLGDEYFWDQSETPLTGPGNPGLKRWWFSADESGTGAERYYGFGLLAMPDQRRGDFSALIKNAMREAGFDPSHEFKWNRINPAALPFYLRLVDDFFKTPYLSFHCIIYDKTLVNVPPYDGDLDLQLRIRLHGFLTNKIQRCLTLYPNREHTFRIWLDRIPSRYRKAGEALHTIANNALKKVRGVKPIDKIIERDSHESPSIELCDVLLGAVLSAWEQKITARAKLAVQHRIAERLGWPDLRHDTFPGQARFNVWLFQDPRERWFHQTRAFRLG